jgi:type I restriction enzyme S subunit
VSQAASIPVGTTNLTVDRAPLPEGWRWVKLGDVCEVVTGSTPSKAESRFYGGTIAWIKPDDLDRAMYVDSSSEYLSDEGAKRARILPAGSVLVSCIGNVGKTAIAAKPLATNQQINSLIPSEEVDSDYLFFACRFIGSAMRAAASVSLVPIINKSSFSALTIPLPLLREQKRSAAILKDQTAAVERARAAVEAQLKAAKDLPAAYLRSVFDSPASQQWQKKRIGDVAKVQSGYAFKSDWFTSDGIRLLRNANIFQGFISWSDTVRLSMSRRAEFEAYEMAEGDIVLSLDRPLVSNGLKVARLTSNDVPALLLQRVGRFQLRGSIDVDYLYAFLNSEKFIKAITTHDQSLGVPHVSPAQVEAVEIPLPSLTEQQQIAKRLSKQIQTSEQTSKILQDQFDSINKLPAALLRQAFTGKL